MPRKRERDAPPVVHRTARCGLRVTRAQRNRLFGLVPVAAYPEGTGPDPARVAGVDLGIIHPYAVAGPAGQQLLVSGRAIRAECRQHLRDRKGRARAAARRAPSPGQRGSRRWRRHKRRQRRAEARHGRRVRQAQHEAAKVVVGWAVEHRVGTLAVGDPRGVLNLQAGRRHNQRTRDWRVGHLIRALRDKAEAAGITVRLVDERGTSSTCPGCSRRVPKPAGRNFRCPHCGRQGHRDLVAAANIAARNGGGGTIPPPAHGAGITHRRAGRHLPGVHPARRDPRRRPPSRPSAHGPPAGTGPPPTATTGRGVARHPARSHQDVGQPPANLQTGALVSGVPRTRKVSMTEAIDGRQGRGRPRSERARAAVLAAATDLLVSGQIDAVTMEAIAARSGVSKSTIYKWWPSRAHVILESFFNRARHTMAVDENASLREVLTSQVLSLIRLFRDSDAGPLMADLMAASQADPDIRAALEEQWLRPRRQVSAGLLRAGIERGELDPGADIDAAVDQLYAPVYYRLLLGHEPLPDALAAALVGQVLDGLRVRPR